MATQSSVLASALSERALLPVSVARKITNFYELSNSHAIMQRKEKDTHDAERAIASFYYQKQNIP